jgi:hypothetical protein
MAAEAEAAREARAKVIKLRDPQITGKCMSWSLKKSLMDWLFIHLMLSYL